MNMIDKIIIHCSATPEGRRTTLEEVTQWHKARGFRTIGYHYLIHLDGSISRGRQEHEQGAHTKGYNKNSIGICYVGGLDKNMKAKDTRTCEQKHALKMLVEQLKDKYTIPTVHGHNEFANKACPCFDVQEWLKEEGL
jgi:N-acetylmuramoyl-L-alanine amidase